MGQRRMFSNRIIGSGKFLKMPADSQLLYFHLGMHADDDGVVEAYSVIRNLGSNEDNLKVLVAKGLVKVLNEDLVSYITDWNEHNLIRSDRKINSTYKDLLLQIVPEADVVLAKPRADTGVLTGNRVTGRPVDVTSKGKLSQDKLSYIGNEPINKTVNKMWRDGETIQLKDCVAIRRFGEWVDSGSHVILDRGHYSELP